MEPATMKNISDEYRAKVVAKALLLGMQPEQMTSTFVGFRALSVDFKFIYGMNEYSLALRWLQNVYPKNWSELI